MPTLSVIIITLNEAKRIANLLQDLAMQTYADFEVIVVDSNSDDTTVAIAKTFAQQLNLTVHVMSNRGVCLGRNTGANLAQCKRLLFLDADVRLAANFINKALRHLHQQQLDVAGVYLSAKTLSRHFKLGYHCFNMGMFATQFTFPTAVGACLFSSKRIHEQIGGFDTSITLCEDCDYVHRASQITRFRMLKLTFGFDPRRFKQDGYVNTGRKYLHANVYRLLVGEIRDQKIRYEFGHYKSDS